MDGCGEIKSQISCATILSKLVYKYRLFFCGGYGRLKERILGSPLFENSNNAKSQENLNVVRVTRLNN